MLKDSFFGSHEEIVTETVIKGFNWEEDIKENFFDIDEPEQIVNYQSEIYATSPNEYMIMVEYNSVPEGLELRKKVSYCFHFKVNKNEYEKLEEALFQKGEYTLKIMKKYLSSVSKKIIKVVPVELNDAEEEL